MYLKIKNVFAPETKIRSQLRFDLQVCVLLRLQHLSWRIMERLGDRWKINYQFNQFEIQVSHKLNHFPISSDKIFQSGDCWSYPEVHWLLRGWTAKGFHQAVPCHWPCKQAKGQGPTFPPCTIWGSGLLSLKYLVVGNIWSSSFFTLNNFKLHFSL